MLNIGIIFQFSTYQQTKVILKNSESEQSMDVSRSLTFTIHRPETTMSGNQNYQLTRKLLPPLKKKPKILCPSLELNLP